MQQGMLMESSLAGQPWANLEQVVLEAPAEFLQPDLLREAWRRLALRHDALRMTLVQSGRGHIRQQLVEAPDFAFTVMTGKPTRIETFLAEDRLAGIDPAIGPGWRVTLFPDPLRPVMVWTIHHALIDGTSLALVLEELGLLLQGLPLGDKPEQTLTEFSAALAHQDKAAAKDFFSAMFQDGAGPQALLPVSTAAPGRMAILTEVLSRAESDALRGFVRAHGATTLNAVQLAWGLVQSRWSGEAKVDFGLVDSGRRIMPGLDRTVGCLISTLPMRLNLDGDETVGTVLARLRRTTLEMRRHAHATPTEVRRWAGLPGSAALFDALLIYSHASLEGRMHRLGGVWQDWRVRLIEEGAAPLTLAVADDPEMQVLLEHDPKRVSPELAKAFLGQFTRLLRAMAGAGPELRLGALDMLDARERAALLELGTPKESLPDDPPCIATRFEAVAAQRPEAVAVIDAATGARTSFVALDRAANHLAARLVGKGIAAGDVVAVHLPRGAGQIVALLAVLKLGAAFLPLDPEQPADWLSGLVARAGAKALISDTGTVICPGAQHLPTLAPDPAAVLDQPPPRPAPDPERLAYVLFTSGSTGEPKAVRGLSGALSAHASAVIAAYGLSQKDRVLHFAGLGFDVSLEEIVPTLLAGATVVARDEAAKASTRACLGLIARHAVTVANLPASFWHVLVDDIWASGQALPASLRLMVTGSERIRPQALRKWRALAPTVDWINGYGPTETTITATAFSLPGGVPLPDTLDEVPIGRPLAHALAILRAPDGSLTPRGGRGKLWIGGPAVSGGYLNDESRSRVAFAENPFGQPGRIYRTGDHARWRQDGSLDFLGRSDRQIKLRGHRIDLNQIEQLLAGLEGVRQAHVALVKDGAERLLAWVLTDANTPIPEIARQARRLLPHAMVPHLIGVDHFPVSANGKIDLASLPRPDFGPAHAEQASEDALTRTIAACMAEVLDRSSVPADQKFSDLGGDSLLGLRLVSLIEQRTGHALQTAFLHNHGSARALAEMLQGGITRPRYTIPIQPNGTRPAFFAIHVLGRNEELFRPLSAALGPDQPFFGLSVGIPRNLDDISVERTARLYFEEIQAFHPTGPVGLGAVSMAAYFAFELAQLLRAAGREVRVLAVLDAMGPGGRPALTGKAKVMAHLQQVRKLGLRHFGRIAKNKIDRYREHREHVHSTPDQINPLDLIAANVVAVEFDRPQPYGGPLTVFRADHSFWDSPEAIDTALGWTSVARGGVQMFDLPGTHLSILEPGNVDVLARHLARLMAEPSAPS